MFERRSNRGTLSNTCVGRENGNHFRFRANVDYFDDRGWIICTAHYNHLHFDFDLLVFTHSRSNYK